MGLERGRPAGPCQRLEALTPRGSRALAWPCRTASRGGCPVRVPFPAPDRDQKRTGGAQESWNRESRCTEPPEAPVLSLPCLDKKAKMSIGPRLIGPPWCAFSTSACLFEEQRLMKTTHGRMSVSRIALRKNATNTVTLLHRAPHASRMVSARGAGSHAGSSTKHIGVDLQKRTRELHACNRSGLQQDGDLGRG
jgi:hypothetical protein